MGLGKIKTDNKGNIFVCHTPKGIISIWNQESNFIGHIAGGNPPINAPRSIGISPNGQTLYVLETSGIGPTRLVKWERILTE